MDEAKWAKHYCTDHDILLVGEGDFSFSLSLARVFGSASNIVATSLDSYELVIKKYARARTNLDMLHKAGAHLLFGVDAMTMKLHPDLHWRKFHRIIYNFPHAGFLGKEADQLVIDKHRYLVLGFFENASGMLRPGGEVHVSHKTTPPFDGWNIKELASRSFLSLLECVDFKIEDYPGYHNKRGNGCRSDDPFPLGKCSTFKFVASSASNISNIPRHTRPPCMNNNEECYRIFKEYFDQANLTFGKHDDYLCHSVRDTLEKGFERCKRVNPVNPLNVYINHVKELHEKSKKRIAYLQQQLLEVDRRYGL
ncbi:putative S-adenosyl-L-methionine-dependent methyltransferase [Helianthus anomalus]